MIDHIKKLKNDNHTDHSVDVEKAFDKSLYPYRIKIMQKEVDMKGTYLNIKKGHLRQIQS